jgi:hypothetical protein
MHPVPRIFLILLALAPLVAGCISTSEQVTQRINERCAARGLQPGTDRFSDCVVQLESERTQRMDQNRRDAMERRPDIPGSRM